MSRNAVTRASPLAFLVCDSRRSTRGVYVGMAAEVHWGICVTARTRKLLTSRSVTATKNSVTAIKKDLCVLCELCGCFLHVTQERRFAPATVLPAAGSAFCSDARAPAAQTPFARSHRP